MKIIRYLLNLPSTIIGLVLVIISIPKRVRFLKDAIVFDIRSFWWEDLAFWMKGVRAAAIGNIVLLGPHLEPFDLEHELVHVRQHMEHSFVMPFLYLAEQLKHGNSPKNKYEEEAYRIAGNVYKGKDK